MLGMIPGVGAIYNGQYAKGLIHAVMFGLLVSIADTVHGGLVGLLVILTIVFVFYMAFEAHHTARKRREGQPLDEMSSLFDMRGGASSGSAIALIVVGVIFLLNTLEVVSMRQILRFWPVLLIALGANMLYSRLTSASDGERGGGERQEVHHEQ